MALYEEFEPRPNRLIDAQSAYLRDAAYQPVGWYEYGEEAFAEARRQHKPVLLDIGASWCHWCHVMDRESYENPAIATLINELFIPVKVDRDERPDIDVRYQTAVHLLSGQGGWPLTAFLDAEGRPFYGATYLPPVGHDNVLGMRDLLPQLAKVYRERSAEAAEAAQAVRAHVEQQAQGATRGEATSTTLGALTHNVSARFSEHYGGFEHTGPKFPRPGAVELALVQWLRTREQHWLTIASQTLTAMGQGGIFDQLGGGFHRYSVDSMWTVPHFEKLGTDNALLLEAYTHVRAATNLSFHTSIAEGTLDFILTVLSDRARGGFYASQDADTGHKDDGSFWTWPYDEVRGLLTGAEAEATIRHYGITPEGDMADGRNVLRVTESAASIAKALEQPVEDVQDRIAVGRLRLRDARSRRHAPRVDETKYAHVNGMLISAVLEAGALLRHRGAQRAALRAAEVMLADAYDPEEGMAHLFHGPRGARWMGLLADQVFGARAFLDAFGITGYRPWLVAARRLMDLLLERHMGPDGGLTDIPDGGRGETAFLRHARTTVEDLPEPSANAFAAIMLDRLWALTGERHYREASLGILDAFAGVAPRFGPYAAYYGLALHHHMHPAPTVVIVGRLDDPLAKALRQEAWATFRPGRQVAPYAPQDAPYPLGPAGQPRAYVCAGGVCGEPTDDPKALAEAIRSHKA